MDEATHAPGALHRRVVDARRISGYAARRGWTGSVRVDDGTVVPQTGSRNREQGVGEIDLTCRLAVPDRQECPHCFAEWETGLWRFEVDTRMPMTFISPSVAGPGGSAQSRPHRRVGNRHGATPGSPLEPVCQSRRIVIEPKVFTRHHVPDRGPYRRRQR